MQISTLFPEHLFAIKERRERQQKKLKLLWGQGCTSLVKAWLYCRRFLWLWEFFRNIYSMKNISDFQKVTILSTRFHHRCSTGSWIRFIMLTILLISILKLNSIKQVFHCEFAYISTQTLAHLSRSLLLGKYAKDSLQKIFGTRLWISSSLKIFCIGWNDI